MTSNEKITIVVFTGLFAAIGAVLVMKGVIGMQELALNNEIIEKIKLEVPELVKSLMKEDLIEVVLYGSCARGDYTEDSDGSR